MVNCTNAANEREKQHATTNWDEILERPDPHVHFVQFYVDETGLARNVGKYLFEGLRQGDSLIVITTPAHWNCFREDMQRRGADVASALRDGKLLFLDAEQTLSRFMVNGGPDWNRFEKTILGAVEWLREDPQAQIRAVGEMVGLLWTSGEYSAAIRLEEYWNRILTALKIPLFCAYPIDVFGPEFQSSGVHAILCDHTHLLPSDEGNVLERTIDEAIREILGHDASRLWSSMEKICRSPWGSIPRAERMILWLRDAYPRQSRRILKLAFEAYNDRQMQSGKAA